MRAKNFSIIIVFFLVIQSVFLLPPAGRAMVIYKECETCHVLFPGLTGKNKGKNKDLRESLCVNCHSNASGDTIKLLGNFRIPVVNNTQEPAKPLAGGNFYYVAGLGERKGHNVHGISPTDMKFGMTPPGYDRANDPSSIGYNPAKPLTCAGSNGCHGDRNVENPFAAIMGSHHAEDNPIDGSTTAKSFRYLRITSSVKGVLGLEDEDWGQDATGLKHNEYSSTINNLCMSCHGNFHYKDKKGAWFRHPVGVPLPVKGEYAGYSSYNPDAPVGRADISGATSRSVKAGRDVVLCISCHMAHGSPYNSSLRWNFEEVFSGKGGRGACFICHTKK